MLDKFVPQVVLVCRTMALGLLLPLLGCQCAHSLSEPRALAGPPMCQLPNGSLAACSPTNQRCVDPPTAGPGYHLTPLCHETSGGNDPCAPIYDPRHQMYHMFFQDHLAASTPSTATGGGGPIWGHWASRDLVKWTRLPVALWNGLDDSVEPFRITPYDNDAVFTGSGTLVNGTIKLVYPGLCNTNATGTDVCAPTTGHGHQCHLGVATPADPMGDVLAHNWTKASFNPFAVNTGRDPSAAWQTRSGEWQFTTYLGDLFGTMDWSAFYQVSTHAFGWGGECPGFFELPRLTPGSVPTPHNYTHVYKHSSGNRDWMILGYYDSPALPRQTGSWTPLHEPQMMDSGGLYASKDFADAMGRRITTGFGHCPGSAGGLVLLREVTFNAELDQLVFTPLPELASLRQATPLLNLTDILLQPSQSLPITSNQSSVEAIVDFEIPSAPASFGISVGGLSFYVNYTARNTSAPFHELAIGMSTGVKDTTKHFAQERWATQHRQQRAPQETETSGRLAKPPTPAPPPLRLSAHDSIISIRLFVDDEFVEAYFQDGRQVITWGRDGKEQSDDRGAIAAFANGAVIRVLRARAFQMNSIWIDADELMSHDDDLNVEKQAPAAVPFSFSLDGTPANLSRWSSTSNTTELDAVRTQTTITYEQHSVGLKAQLQRTDYAYFVNDGGRHVQFSKNGRASSSEYLSAEELLLRFRNDGATDSPLLCNVSTLDRTWPLAVSAAVTLHTNGGSFARSPPLFDYSPGIMDLPLGANVSILPEEGMSSDGVMPWFALELDGDGPRGGAVLSLGWTGNWRLQVTRDTLGVRVRASVCDLCAVIQPGESFRLLRVLLVPIVRDTQSTSATALRTAINLHRRILVDFKIPRKSSDRTSFQGALTASWTWGGWPAPYLNETGQHQHITWINSIGAEAWWLDAGWFNAPWTGAVSRTGSFPAGIGNWRLPASESINSSMFPRGLKPLSTAARAKGLRSVVWFDIEGVYPKTTIWNMTHSQDICFREFSSGQRCQLGGTHSLVDLGNNRTWQYLLDFSTSAIEEYGIDVFRLDYNVGAGGEPCVMLPCWRAADAPNRTGMAEVRYVQGLYDLWDALLSRFASRDLFIDNCAGGGRRIDLETISRSVPLWRSDAACPSAEASQATSMGVSLVLPISSGATCGGSTGAIAPYEWRSAGVVGKAISWGPATWEAIIGDPSLLAQARAAVAETKRIRLIGIEGDYYPLSNITADDRVNVAYQFHRRNESDGFVYVFHRSRAATKFSIKLHGVNPIATYQLDFSRNYSVQRTVTMLGSQMRAAVELSFNQPQDSQMPQIGSFKPPRLHNNTRLWGSLAGPTYNATTFGDCVNGCAKLGAVCAGATLTLSFTASDARVCYPLKDITKVQFEDAPGYASILRKDACVESPTRKCTGSVLIEYKPVHTQTPAGDPLQFNVSDVIKKQTE